MAIEQSIDSPLARTIGAGGFPETAIDAGLRLVEKALTRLREDDGERPAAASAHAARERRSRRHPRTRRRGSARDATDVVFLGTGGSSLGGQTLAQLQATTPCRAPAASPRTPRVHFLDNLDPITFEHVLHRLPLATTRFVAISKSGGTGETLMQTIAVLSALDQAGLRAAPGELFLGLSEPRRRGRQRTRCATSSSRRACAFLDHHTGDRRALLGADQCRPPAGRRARARHRGRPRRRRRRLRAGPRRRGRPGDARPALGAAARGRRGARGHGASRSLMAYADRLERFTRWWVQLWAESLGKDGKGTQPVAAIGPVDQHSQLQLYLAGPERQALHGDRPPASPGRGR